MHASRLKAIFFFFVVFILSCTLSAQGDLPADKNATKETIRLYNNLKRLANMKKGGVISRM
jgi:hypothetical protein